MMDLLPRSLSGRSLALVVAAAFAAGLLVGSQEQIWVRLGAIAALAVLLWRLRDSVRAGAEDSRLDRSTGLANTRVLFDEVAGEVERARRYARPFTLLYVTVVGLPSVRQRAGEEGVEDVLRRVAHHLKGSLRTVDLVARLRDREFAVLLPETAVEAAVVVLGRIRRTLLAATLEDPGEEISFSIGATTWLHADLSVDELHQRTYQLVYAAQRAGEVLRHEVLGEGAVAEVTHRHLMLRR